MHQDEIEMLAALGEIKFMNLNGGSNNDEICALEEKRTRALKNYYRREHNVEILVFPMQLFS